MESAKEVNDPGMWGRLASAALEHDNPAIVEMAYSKSGDYERLAFLYLVTGNIAKLQKLVDRDDVDRQLALVYQMYLGNGTAFEPPKPLACFTFESS